MSRNSSGTYTLPAGNPVVSGTLIEASWANNTLSDLATAMTDSLSRSGEGGMTAALRGVDGSNTTPAYSFTAETATGFYRAGTNDVRLAIAGVDRVKTTASGVEVTGGVSASTGFTGNLTGNVTGNVSGTAGGLSATLAVTSGGTGQITYTDGQLLIGNSTGNTLTKATLTAGTGVSITNGGGSITIAATGSGGTVTSVGLSMPSGFSVANSPVTGSGTLTVTTTLNGVLKGNGSGFTTASAGTDYAPATSGTSILYGNGSGGFSNVTVGTGLTFSAGTLSASGTSGTNIGLSRAIAINCILP